MQTRQIGPVAVSAIGLGGMPMSIEGRPDEERSIRTIHAALDAGVTLIDIARRVLGDGNLASVQNQFSPSFRSSEPELRHCATRGIAFLPFRPLGGISRAGQLGERHAAFQDVASAHGVSPQQVALAWMLAKAPAMIPIPGASRPESVTDSAAAADLVLSNAELDRLDQA
jgi:aryl-alcohol dehydrogenase-like predicted oxidoreductase